jgi:hypothetical protein
MMAQTSNSTRFHVGGMDCASCVAKGPAHIGLPDELLPRLSGDALGPSLIGRLGTQVYFVLDSSGPAVLNIGTS